MNASEYYILSAIVFSFFLTLIILAYVPRICAWFGAFKKPERLVNQKHNRIAVLVPAKDESWTIEPLLDSLSRQDYKDFEVFVIVDKKGDPTISMADLRGFRSIIVEKQSRKGDALEGAFDEMLANGKDVFDAYLILDADTGIGDDYLRQMNNAMASGRDVIVSKKIVKNYSLGGKALSFQGAANGYIWTLFDHMGNKYKSAHHISLFTVGSGLLISKKVILANQGWHYKSTLTEDCELAADMIANHWTSYYAESAPIYMEEAPTLSMTNKRRRRWMGGLTEAQRLYRDKCRGLGSLRDRYFSYSIYLSYLYFGALSLYFLGNFIAATITFFLNRAVFMYPLFAAVGSLSLIYLSLLFMAIVAFFASLHDVKGHWLFRVATIFFVPFHYLGYFPIMGHIFLHPEESSSLERIERCDEKEASK